MAVGVNSNADGAGVTAISYNSGNNSTISTTNCSFFWNFANVNAGITGIDKSKNETVCMKSIWLFDKMSLQTLKKFVEKGWIQYCCPSNRGNFQTFFRKLLNNISSKAYITYQNSLQVLQGSFNGMGSLGPHGDSGYLRTKVWFWTTYSLYNFIENGRRLVYHEISKTTDLHDYSSSDVFSLSGYSNNWIGYKYGTFSIEWRITCFSLIC